MPANTDKIDSLILQRGNFLGKALCRVNMKISFTALKPGRNIFDRLQNTCLVIYVHNGDQERVIANTRDHIVPINSPTAIHWENRYLKTSCGKMLHRLEYSLVLYRSSHNVPLADSATFVSKPKDRQVVALSRTAGENHLFTLSIDDFPDLITRPLHGLLRQIAKLMSSTTRVPILVPCKTSHGLRDSLLNRCGRIAVQICRHFWLNRVIS